MKRFLLHCSAWLVMANVVAAVGLGGVGAGALQSARVGREFRVRAGRAVTLDGGSLRLKFVSVASDSRCPVNVDCIWAGNAEVLVEAGAKGGRGKRTLKLNTNAGPERPGEGKYVRYTVKLLGLTPQPRAGRKIKASEYTATLLVVKD